ncbi:MAG: glycosyltransferase [archaeon]
MVIKNSKIIRYFKDKRILIAGVNVEDQEANNIDLHSLFKTAFKKVITFDLRKQYFLHGSKTLNENFINILKKETPEYILLILGYDELDLESLKKIKEICPNTKVFIQYGDDRWKFDDWARYYSLFSDYVLTTEKENSYYKEDGINDVYPWYGVDIKLFKPNNLKKIYDTSFIGCPMSNRGDYVKFLTDKVNIKLFGGGWDAYPELKKVYKGYLDSEEYSNTINKTKINISFSKSYYPGRGDTHFKSRLFEVFATNSFLLVEYYPQLKLYYNKYYDKISFNSKNELLKKIKYYLENEEEMKKMTEYFYKETIKNYSWEKQLENLLHILYKDRDRKPKKELPKLKNKIIELNEEDLKKPSDYLKQKTKSFDYICFKKDETLPSKYKTYFQIYSLEKSKKQISCCDYHLYSKKLGDYMLFTAKRAFETIEDKNNFNKLLNINQIAVTKNFFFNNLKKFKKIFNNDTIDFINNDNTVFISIPLVQIKNLRIKSDNEINKAFRMKFFDKLYLLIQSKKIISNRYIYDFFIESLFRGDFLLLKSFFGYIFNKENLIRLVAVKRSVN